MHPHYSHQNASSQQKTSALDPFASRSFTSRQLASSITKESKIKHLNQLISMKQNNHFNCNSVLTKQIHLHVQNNPSQNKTNKKHSNSKTKINLSIKKNNVYKASIGKSSTQSLQSGRKQKISILSKIQTIKIRPYESVESGHKRSQSRENKQKIENNNQQNSNLPNPCQYFPDYDISELMINKLNEKKQLFFQRAIKPTREIIQMKENNKEKQKIKIKLQKKTKNHLFRV